MGLQVSRGIYTEEAEEDDIWSDPKASWRDISGVGGTEGMPSCGRPFDVGSRAYLYQHSAEVLGVVCGWVYQREECYIDSEAICGKDEELHGREFLGQRLFCDHDWT
jgi:hypothetical protein